MYSNALYVCVYIHASITENCILCRFIQMTEIILKIDNKLISTFFFFPLVMNDE